jgi:hypothetical protein
MEGALPFIVSGDDDGGGVNAIKAKVERYKPHALYIDGAYLLEDDRYAKSRHERLDNIAWDLKKGIARKYGIPVIFSHQFNQEGKELEGNENTLAYGDMQKWSDGMLGMYQTDDLRLNKEMLVRLLKQREGEKFEFVTGWDLDSMSFDTHENGVDDIGKNVEYSDEEAINF